MTPSDDRYWGRRNSEQWEAGREAARGDIGSGLLKFKVSCDEVFLTPSMGEVLSEMADIGIDCDTYGDLNAPDPAYVAAYNHEMEGEIDRRYGPSVWRTWRERAKRGQRQRPQEGD